MHFTRFSHRRNATYNLNRLNRVNALCYLDLNNRRTGKHVTKPRALGLLGHSVYAALNKILKINIFTLQFRVRPINQTARGGTLHQLHLDSFVQTSESGYSTYLHME